MSEISQSAEYISFRSTVPQRKVIVDNDSNKEWKMYEAGPRHVRCPMIFLAPASGTADIFFRQLLSLSALGYRVISLEYPKYWTMAEWCEGFKKLLDVLHLDKVHIFGASLGGFLAQKFAETNFRCQRVQSLFLCNSFTDTAVFQQNDSASMFWMMPSLLLKRMVMWTFDHTVVDSEIADSIDFMVEKLDGLSQSDLACRLTLNCVDAYIQPQKIQDLDITIMDVFDNCVISQLVKEEVYKCYPDGKRAHLKNGGNFPYLSRSPEVNLHIRIHLRKFEGTRYSAKDELVGHPEVPPSCSSSTSEIVDEDNNDDNDETDQ